MVQNRVEEIVTMRLSIRGKVLKIDHPQRFISKERFEGGK